MVRTVHGLPEPGDLGSRRLVVYHRLESFVSRFCCRGTAYVSMDLWRRSGEPVLSPTCRIIRNGLEFGQLTARRAHKTLCHFGVVGRLVQVKGHDVALAALATVSPDIPVRLSIIGDGPAGDDLRALSQRLGVSDRVEFVGFQNDMPSWYESWTPCSCLLATKAFRMPSLRLWGPAWR